MSSDGRAAVALLVVLLGGACRQDMHDQAKVEPFELSTFFPDRHGSRPAPSGTVARGELRDDDLLWTGREGGEVAARFAFPVTRDVLLRGRERFDIFCAPCHDRTGNGQGMVVRRGFPRPPSFHQDRLRQAAPGALFDVVTNGFGVMPGYAAQIPVRDRWAIVAYLRALQLSQNATLSDVPAPVRPSLPGGAP